MTQVFLIIVISLSGILAVIVMIKKNKKLSAIDHVPPLTLSHREH